jgi:hypothetical protein
VHPALLHLGGIVLRMAAVKSRHMDTARMKSHFGCQPRESDVKLPVALGQQVRSPEKKIPDRLVFLRSPKSLHMESPAWPTFALHQGARCHVMFVKKTAIEEAYVLTLPLTFAIY